MERVKSQKMKVTHVAVVPDEQADVPGVTVIQEQVRPTPKGKPVLDPAQRPQYSLDGYGAPVHAFTTGIGELAHINKGKSPIEKDLVKVYFREKLHDDKNKVRVYYAGAVLLGSASFSSMGITAHFQHNLGAEQYTACESVDALHTYLRSLLQQAVA